MPPTASPKDGSPEEAGVAAENGSSATNGSGPPRKKHVEVCVRIRPLLVGGKGGGSSNSFFRQTHGKSHHPSHSPTSKSSPSPTKAAATTTTASTATSSSTKMATPSKSKTPSFLSRLRKPQIPRPGTPTRKRGMDLFNNNKNTTTTKQNQDPPDDIYAWDVRSEDTVCQSDATEKIKGRTHSYTLDRVYGPSKTTQQLYDGSVRELVHAAMDGYHTAVLAYGQTSTGKTHTMTGTGAQPGLIPLAIQECFQYLSDAPAGREYLLRVSYLEVYKEHIRDLLATSTAAPPVRMFDSADGLVIKGLQEVVVTSPREVFALLQQGEARRQIGATHLNQHSSRSHVMVRLWVESSPSSSSSSSTSSNGGGGGSSAALTHATSSVSSISASQHTGGRANNKSATRVSSLSLVDLAGSESVRLTGSNERREEGHYINKSLMTLGQVVYALSEMKDDGKQQSRKHVPFRDSKLTRLLQPSLSGNAQVVLLCCISPLVNHIEESHNTFKFATRAKKIPQRATIQETENEKSLLQSYREEIEDLKRQLREMREQQDQLMEKATAGTATTASSLVSAASDVSSDTVSEGEIQELVEAIETMEKLILKSSATHPPVQPEDLIDLTEGSFEGFELEEKNLLALAPSRSEDGGRHFASARTPAMHRTPAATATAAAASSSATPATTPNSEAFHEELSRIKGLLGSVLQKRMTSAEKEKQQQQQQQQATAANSDQSDEVVRNLRAQLEEQEVASNLRKADSSFLQAQLEEKDNLLQEVSKILEAVEVRQARLEEENAALRKENALLKQHAHIQGNGTA